MERPVTALAQHIQKAMTTLYNLQTALLNAVEQNGTSNPLLDEIQKIRINFKSEWENIIAFLQHCHGYTEDYLSLCEFATTRSDSECWALLSDVVMGAKRISDEAESAKNLHERRYKELRIHRSQINNVFAGRFSKFAPETLRDVTGRLFHQASYTFQFTELYISTKSKAFTRFITDTICRSRSGVSISRWSPFHYGVIRCAQ